MFHHAPTSLSQTCFFVFMFILLMSASGSSFIYMIAWRLLKICLCSTCVLCNEFCWTKHFMSCFGRFDRALILKKTQKNGKVGKVTETKVFMRGSGSSVCQGWQMLRRDWPVPARMGFAVNRSQLVQSDWKETAQKGHFVSAAVCQAGWKNKTQSLALSSHPAGPHRSLWGQINFEFRLVLPSLCWLTRQCSTTLLPPLRHCWCKYCLLCCIQ